MAERAPVQEHAGDVQVRPVGQPGVHARGLHDREDRCVDGEAGELGGRPGARGSRARPEQHRRHRQGDRSCEEGAAGGGALLKVREQHVRQGGGGVQPQGDQGARAPEVADSVARVAPLLVAAGKAEARRDEETLLRGCRPDGRQAAPVPPEQGRGYGVEEEQSREHQEGPRGAAYRAEHCHFHRDHNRRIWRCRQEFGRGGQEHLHRPRAPRVVAVPAAAGIGLQERFPALRRGTIAAPLPPAHPLVHDLCGGETACRGAEHPPGERRVRVSLHEAVDDVRHGALGCEVQRGSPVVGMGLAGPDGAPGCVVSAGHQLHCRHLPGHDGGGEQAGTHGLCKHQRVLKGPPAPGG
mmetsp:Transcript_41518/g.98390  ORF Transcript_41518/g.98390 Transcript_41518/m.98390 type:complete len:353 (+) Transcript_41518:469-1527(+)